MADSNFEPYPGFAHELTHVLPITTADDTRISGGVALYYNARETLGPDHATIALGRVAGHWIDEISQNRIYEAGVGTGAFFVSAAINSMLTKSQGLHVAGNDISTYALRTTAYNLEELRQKRNMRIIAELKQGDWQYTLADHSDDASYAAAHFNPPFKTRGDNVGVGDGAVAPDLALYATHDEAGYPLDYERYLPSIYRRITNNGVALVRLPSGRHEANFDVDGFDKHIEAIQAKALRALGLRYAKVLVDIPEKTPTPWGSVRGKQIPYRVAAGLIVSRTIPGFMAGSMRPYDQDPTQTILYEDIQYRIRAIGNSAATALVQI